MNEAVIALMIVTANGIVPGPTFYTYEECEAVSANIKTQETFCYYQEPVNINGAIAQLGDMMKKMKEQLNEIENNEDAVPTL
jgi:hypothetical protein